MTADVRAMIQDWVAKDNGNIDRTVNWAARNMKGVSNSKRWWREQIQEAMKEAA